MLVALPSRMLLGSPAGAVLAVVLCGCVQPQWDEKNAERRDTIRYDVDLLRQRHEANRPNLREIRDLHRDSIDRHHESLQDSSRMIDQRLDKEFVDWRADRYNRRHNCYRVFRGQPETIPDTWAKMVY